MRTSPWRCASRYPSPRKRRTIPSPIRALLILGGCCHDYANQQKILADGISHRANVEVTIAYDLDKGTQHLNPVYAKPDWYKGYDVIIHCGVGS